MAEKLPQLPKNFSSDNCEYASMYTVSDASTSEPPNSITIEENHIVARCEHPSTGFVSRLAALAIYGTTREAHALPLALAQDSSLEARLPQGVLAARLHVLISTQSHFFAVMARIRETPVLTLEEKPGHYIQLHHSPKDEYPKDEYVQRAARQIGFDPMHSVDVHEMQFYPSRGPNIFTEALVAGPQDESDELSIGVGSIDSSAAASKRGITTDDVVAASPTAIDVLREEPILRGTFRLRVVGEKLP